MERERREGEEHRKKTSAREGGRREEKKKFKDHTRNKRKEKVTKLNHCESKTR